jgi:hypothetical protein
MSYGKERRVLMRGSRLAALWIILLSVVIATPSVMAAEDWETKICWKQTYERGVGKIPICEQKHEKDAGLCYGACKLGFKGVGPVCWKACPSGYHDDGATCRRDAHIIKKDSYGRGVGKPLPCRDGRERDAGLCYQKCRDGYKGVGPVCWMHCTDGYHDDGATCRRDAHIFGKENYGRGVGTVPKTCPSGQQYDAGLCYPTCKNEYKGIGPVCWAKCKKLSANGIMMHTDCGAACSTTRDACTKWAGSLTKEGFEVLGSAIISILPNMSSQLTAAMKEYPIHLPKCQ